MQKYKSHKYKYKMKNMAYNYMNYAYLPLSICNTNR